MYSHETSINPSGTMASSWAVALIAVVAPLVLVLVFLVAAAACLVAWPFAPVWAFVAHRKKVCTAQERENDMVLVAARPGEPGCSVIVHHSADLTTEPFRGMLVELVTRKEATARMNEFLKWVDEQRVKKGLEPFA